MIQTFLHLKKGDRISLERQLNNHNEIVLRLFRLQENTNEYLRKCLYLFNIGSNDYINNYLRSTLYNSSHKYTPDQFASFLVQQYSQHLKRLYTLGGRKIVVFGLAPIGCTPAVINIFGTKGKLCVESINDLVKQFNDKLKPLVDGINHDTVDAKFTFINVTHISSLQHALPGPKLPCCEVMVDGQCAHTATTCPFRALAIYYDGIHPTEMAHNVIATSSYIALSPMDASPYDISHLVRL
ncbi:putative triacylglycerol lipase [Helianthus annuus]|nr:putative triacylglycerol lipase [Helianthus annuus]